MNLIFTLLVFVFLSAQATSSTFSTFSPSALPLAVKGPYFSSWLAGGANEGLLSLTTPSFWTAWDDVSVTYFSFYNILNRIF